MRIQVPPVDVQKKIVEEFNAIDAQINSCDENIQSLDADIQKKFTALFVDKNFPTRKLGEFSETITKGTTPTTLGFSFVERGINFVKVENITEDGEITENELAHITQDCHEKFQRSQLKDGDIIFSIAGSLGRVAVVSAKILPANTNQALAIIRLKAHENICKPFLVKALRSDSVKVQWAQMKKGIAQFNLNLQNIADLKIPMPPLELQKEFASYVETCESMKKSARERREKLIGERAELVTKYFR